MIFMPSLISWHRFLVTDWPHRTLLPCYENVNATIYWTSKELSIIRAMLPQIYLGLRGIVILNLGLQLCNVIVICHVELFEIAKLAISNCECQKSAISGRFTLFKDHRDWLGLRLSSIIVICPTNSWGQAHRQENRKNRILTCLTCRCYMVHLTKP